VRRAFRRANEITIEHLQRDPRQRNLPRRDQQPINLTPAQPLSFVKLAAAAPMTDLRDLVAEELRPARRPRVTAVAEASQRSTVRQRRSFLWFVPARKQLDGLMLDSI
jgi:hypothetical protein